MASVRLEMAFIWSSGLVVRPLAAPRKRMRVAQRAWRCQAVVWRQLYLSSKKNRASVHRQTRIAPHLRTRGLTRIAEQHAVSVDAQQAAAFAGKKSPPLSLRNCSVNSLQSNTVSGRQQQHLARSHGPNVDRHADDDDL